MFFKRQKDLGNSLEYVNHKINGLCYKIGNDTFIRKNDNWYKFYSPRAFQSWGLPAYCGFHPFEDVAGTVGFRDGSLIQNAKDGKIYVISNAKRRLLTAPLGDYGFDYSQVIEVSDAEIQFHAEGEDI